MKRSDLFNKKLYVEGNTDLYAIAEIRNKCKINDNFDIKVYDSISKLIAGITTILKTSDLESIGFVVDADENINNIWNELRRKFSESSFSLPNEIENDGLIFEQDNKKIGIWIMPNNELNGTLEDFLHYLLPGDDMVMSEIDIHINNVEEKEFHKYNANNRSKAKIHSWLALQESPGTPIGKAINYNYFKIDNPECQKFTKWISNLFS